MLNEIYIEPNYGFDSEKAKNSEENKNLNSKNQKTDVSEHGETTVKKTISPKIQKLLSQLHYYEVQSQDITKRVKSKAIMKGIQTRIAKEKYLELVNSKYNQLELF